MIRNSNTRCLFKRNKNLCPQKTYIVVLFTIETGNPNNDQQRNSQQMEVYSGSIFMVLLKIMRPFLIIYTENRQNYDIHTSFQHKMLGNHHGSAEEEKQGKQGAVS